MLILPIVCPLFLQADQTGRSTVFSLTEFRSFKQNFVLYGALFGLGTLGLQVAARLAGRECNGFPPERLEQV